ncbi:hypothetical protein WP50_32575, partial [Lactiplantibacillus plantarum]
MKQIGETIVDIHGQNEHQELMQPEKHLGLLDEFAAAKIRKLKQRYQQQYDRYQQLNLEFVLQGMFILPADGVTAQLLDEA